MVKEGVPGAVPVPVADDTLIKQLGCDYNHVERNSPSTSVESSMKQETNPSLAGW